MKTEQQIWHALSPQEAMNALTSDPSGLAADEAARRLLELGANELTRKGGDGLWQMLWRQLNNPIGWLLIVAGFVSLSLSKIPDAIVVFGAVVINAIIGFIQEYRAGKAIDELADQTRALFNHKDVEVEVYPKRIAFNVLPHIDVFMENGYTKEEMKMVWETRKIMEDDSIQVNPTAVRVPVFYGHSEAVHIETRSKITADEARALLEKAPGVVVVDRREPGGYPTPIEAAGNDATYVGRIREDISHPLGLNLWVVSDNVRKGAALNSVQIAEILIAKYLS